MDSWALIRAARKGDLQWMQSLLNAVSCDINITDKDGWTPLHLAAMHGHAPCVQLLLQHGANANIKECLDGFTPLHCAAWEGHTPCVQLLLQNGANANIQEKIGWTPLHWAARCGDTPCVQLLLQYGADANIQDGIGRTPLHWAAWWGNTPCVQLLLQCGAYANIQDGWGRTPLHYAAEEGHTPYVQLLLQHGADANIQDEDGRTASMLVGKYDLAALLRRFEKPDIKGYIQTRTLQHVADMLNHEECSVLNIVNLNANDEDEFQRQKVEGLRSWTSMKEIKDIGQLIAGLQSANLQRLSDAAKEHYADVVKEISNLNDGEFAVLCRGLDTAKYMYTNTQRPTASDTRSPSQSQDHKYDAFINSSDVDRETVKPILEQLKANGIKCWFEEEDSEPGRYIIECAIEAIDASKRSIVFLTRAYIKDGRCRLLQYHALESNQRTVIPVLMDISPEEIPIPLKPVGYLSVNDEQLVPKLVQAIKGTEKAPTNGELLRKIEILQEENKTGAEQNEVLREENRIGAEQIETLQEEVRNLTAKLRKVSSQ